MDKSDPSALMSKLLLQRWKMLSAVCPVKGCYNPLLENPENQKTFCANHGYTEDMSLDSSPDSETVSKDEKVNQELISKNEPQQSDTPIFSEFPNNTDRVKRQRVFAQEQIGQLLLTGWTLLDTTCPNKECVGIPLVRNSDHIEKCVACGKNYISESAYLKNKEKFLHTKDESSALSKNTAVPSAPKKASPPTKSNTLKSNPAVEGHAELSIACSDIQKTIIDSVNKKILDLLKMLQESKDTSEINNILDTIQNCISLNKSISKE
ncbi:hypothetical protein BB560_000567 [Smittium megazygosporum]|uniref:Uncharacterized protein n=1 Tax=Smittium megazygosporum TaxID=133381 RepID=A0A2T9ZK29_9FUNG|nr:hypothetical protein BB560_000567 [Smittium megazygosporum]